MGDETPQSIVGCECHAVVAQDPPFSGPFNATYSALATDLNGDDLADIVLGGPRISVFLNETETAEIAGDANRDGVFNSSDLVQVFKRGHYEDEIMGNSSWEDGDWNGDREFDSGDLVWAFKEGHYEATAGPIESQLAAAVEWLFAQDDEANKGRAFVA